MGDYTKKACIIVDVDGTLQDVEHRRHFVSGKKKDFHAFYEAMGDDTPVYHIIGLVNMYMMNQWPIIICTGRPETYRQITEEKLRSHGLLRWEMLMMRPLERLYDKDADIKRDMLNELRESGWTPEIAIDDRNQVVEMWREEGLICLQVADGDF